ncbi:MAG TPA: S41 family peptidase, partial [Acidobacteriota bacterium]|nr:S41 family peptidase [Acidobacteriota bacterium]
MCNYRFSVPGLLVLIILSLCPTVLAQDQELRTLRQTTEKKPQNLGFEDGTLGQLPAGWRRVPAQYPYDAKLVNDRVKQGNQAAYLFPKPGVTPQSYEFGNLMQTVDATKYRNKQVRFRAALRVKTESNESEGRLWIRVDRPHSVVGFFDTTLDDAVYQDQDWQYIEVIAEVDDDAETLNFGILSIGDAQVWMDDASLEVVGDIISLKEPARPLTEQGRRNVMAFTRMLGYVRHFHPSDQAAEVDWVKFAVHGIRDIEKVATDAELIRALNDLFSPIAPTVQVFAEKKPPALHPALFPPTGTTGSISVIRWFHRGFQGSEPRSAYSNQRRSQPYRNNTIPDGYGDPAKPFEANLGGGIQCRIPSNLFRDRDGTFPHVEKRTEFPTIEKFTGNDRATRLADVALAWNILQHFYPYFDIANVNWMEVLPKALNLAANDKNEAVFEKTLQWLIAQLNDGHGNAVDAVYPTGAIPLSWTWAENQLVVTSLAVSDIPNLKPGDVVVEVNGKPTAKVIEKLEKYISGATPQWKRFRSVDALRFGDAGDTATLKLRSVEGDLKTVKIEFSSEFLYYAEPRPEKYQELSPGIWYFDLERCNDDDFKAILPKLESAKGIIFDGRGYPSVNPIVIQHLITQDVQSAIFAVPIVSTPDHVSMTDFDTRGRWLLNPKSPHLTAKCVFLIDGRAISYAESFLAIIEAYKLGELVGEPTAGTNGNIVIKDFPRNFRLVWTGMRVTKHDNTPHHGVGVLPTIP